MARILVVDDEPDVRELFNITLKMAGHNTETAKDGMEAVGKLESDVPDLILLDLMMPRMDGFGLLNHIRKEMDSKPMRVLTTFTVIQDIAQNVAGKAATVESITKFGAEIHDGFVWGRGAVDMKGAIACFVAAVTNHSSVPRPEING